MRIWFELIERIRARVFRAREERELSEEVAFHLEMETRKNELAGMTQAQAHRRARLAFGGSEQIKEAVRAQRGLSWLDHIGRDVRHALRVMGRMPGLTAVVIGSLSVGIGVNTAIFSWIEALVLNPIPGVEDSSDFYQIEPRSEAGTYPGVSWLEYRDLRERLPSFRDVMAFRMVPLNLGAAGEEVRRYGLLVSGNYFNVLGLRPAFGRFFLPDEVTNPGSAPVVVLSYDYWQSRFAGASDALHQAVRVNGRDLEVIGVAPRDFQGTVMPLSFDLFVPATLAPVLMRGSSELQDRSARGYLALGRLRPGATLERAQVEADHAMAELARLYPEANRRGHASGARGLHGAIARSEAVGMRAEIVPYWRSLRGPPRMIAGAVFVLQGVMLLLLFAVCANTANLMLARASVRQREIAVRRALGAGRARIVSLLLTENLVMALLAAALGTLLAVWGTSALRNVPLISTFPIKFETHLNGTSLGFAMVLGIVCGLVVGIVPALQLARSERDLSLRSNVRTLTRSPLRSAIVAAQVALALVVLVMGGLFLRSFSRTRDPSPGFQREGVLLAAYDFAGRDIENAETTPFVDQLLDRVRGLPGVQSAAVAASVPLDIHGLPLGPFTLEGRSQTEAGSDQALRNTVTPGYFATMGIAFESGRDFADLSDPATPPQVVVNQEFVRRFLGDGEPIGRIIRNSNKRFAIIGVVSNSTYDSFGEDATPIIYYSYRDRPAGWGQIHLRVASGSEMALAPELRRVVRQLDPSMPLYDVRTLEEHVEKNLFLRRIPARMFVVLGPLLLALVAIGIYAVVAFSVARRTAEIGLRLALGASTRNVVGQILRESMRVVGYGLLVGWMLSFLIYIHVAAGRPLDPPVMFGIPALLILIAALSSWLPARGATRVDPMVALGSE